MEDLARLRWQCRRGTLELDRLLTRYLQEIYLNSNSKEQALFQDLLAYEDNHLLALLSGSKQHASPAMQILINKIRDAPKAGQVQ